MYSGEVAKVTARQTIPADKKRLSFGNRTARVFELAHRQHRVRRGLCDLIIRAVKQPKPARRFRDCARHPQGKASCKNKGCFVVPKRQKQNPVQTALAIVPRMLTVSDTSKYLGIGPWAVRKLHWDGALRGVMLGRRLMFDRLKIDAYVDRLQAEAL